MTQVVRGVRFSAQDRDLVERALGPYGAALGFDDKERARVGVHVNRIVGNAGGSGARDDGDDEGHAGEPYFEDDLLSLLDVVGDLADLFRPQASVDYWRAQGAPGHEDAVQGLADGRRVAVKNLEFLAANVVLWLAMVHGDVREAVPS